MMVALIETKSYNVIFFRDGFAIDNLPLFTDGWTMIGCCFIVRQFLHFCDPLHVQQVIQYFLHAMESVHGVNVSSYLSSLD